jgi:hypothetical protein
VHQGVVVHELTVERGMIHVDLYGGPDNVCTSALFAPKDASSRRSHLRTLRRWQRAKTPLTFMVTRSGMSLQDTPATADRALEDS